MLCMPAAAMEFHQFEGEEYHVDINQLRRAPDGHDLHFIQDANDNVFEWNEKNKQYLHHDVEKHHNEQGHHHRTVFDFPAGSPPETLQTDDAGHDLIEILNTRVRIDFFFLFNFFFDPATSLLSLLSLLLLSLLLLLLPLLWQGQLATFNSARSL